MIIQILGSGCCNCNKLEENVKNAVKQIGKDIDIVKITEIQEIISFGVMTTPALAINGKVKSAGKILNMNEIIKLIGDNA